MATLGRDDDVQRQCSARRRALLYRGFASASSTHARPRSFIRPHAGIFDGAHLAAARRSSTLAAPSSSLVAAAPREAEFDVRRAVRASARPYGDVFVHGSTPMPTGLGKTYPEPPFKGLLSALKPLSLTITVVKCYGLSFGNLMFGAEMEEQTITDEQISSAHKASLELVLRELATTTLRRMLEKVAILALSRRAAHKLLKARGARRGVCSEAEREGRSGGRLARERASACAARDHSPPSIDARRALALLSATQPSPPRLASLPPCTPPVGCRRVRAAQGDARRPLLRRRAHRAHFAALVAARALGDVDGRGVDRYRRDAARPDPAQGLRADDRAPRAEPADLRAGRRGGRLGAHPLLPGHGHLHRSAAR